MKRESTKDRAMRYIIDWHIQYGEKRQKMITEKNLVGMGICASEDEGRALIYELVGEGRIEYKVLPNRMVREIVALPKAFVYFSDKEKAKREKRAQTIKYFIATTIALITAATTIWATFFRKG